jgi:hypothetical protein
VPRVIRTKRKLAETGDSPESARLEHKFLRSFALSPFCVAWSAETCELSDELLRAAGDAIVLNDIHLRA